MSTIPVFLVEITFFVETVSLTKTGSLLWIQKYFVWFLLIDGF